MVDFIKVRRKQYDQQCGIETEMIPEETARRMKLVTLGRLSAFTYDPRVHEKYKNYKIMIYMVIYDFQ